MPLLAALPQFGKVATGLLLAISLIAVQLVVATPAQAAPSGIPGSVLLAPGNYLSTQNSSDFVMGASDFTAELWVHPTALPGSFTGVLSLGLPQPGQFTWNGSNGVWGHEIRIVQGWNGGNVIGFSAPSNDSTSDVFTTGSAAMPLGEWTHVALVRNGSTMTLYVDGVSVATRTGVTFTHTGFPAQSGLGAFYLGRDGGWGDTDFTGAVADVRLVKGSALYTSNFTVPTSPVGVSGGSNTKMLLNTNYSAANTAADFAFNGASNATTVTATGTPNSSNMTPYQPLDTALSFTAASSMHGYSNTATPPLGNLATYTVEGWIRPNVACIQSNVRCEAIARDGDYDIAISNGTYQLVFFYNGQSNSGWLNTGVPATAGAWAHVAITRSGTAAKFYINGVLAYSYTLASAVAAYYTTQPFRIGYVGYSSYFFDGQIDEVKLWNVARTQAQIQSTLYSAPSDLADSTLLAYYDFNSGFGSVLVNRKVGAATTSFLTLENSPTWVDVKTESTSGIDTTITIPRTYINTFGGFELPTSVSNYDYLVVAGGGGGGNGYNNGGGGGGGGGMVLTGLATNTPNAVLQAKVGIGGAGGVKQASDSQGTNGDSSILGGITALGGGYGKASRTNTNGLGGAKQVSATSSGVGGNGGGSSGGGGGGGGAGGAGGDRSGATPGSGGSGMSVTIGSVTATYGAGATGAAGSVATVGVWGALNTGNGGGGGGAGASASNAGGNGATGVILLHYSSGNTISISHSTGQPTYRIAGTITLTALTAGRVTFLERDKRIPGCINRSTNVSNVATCSWKPSTRGVVAITMIFVASNGATNNQTTTTNFVVSKRTTQR